MTVQPQEPPREVWVDDRIVVQVSEIEGRGLFADDGIPEGTVVIRLAGRFVSSAELHALIAAATVTGGTYVDSITVYEDKHLVLPSQTVAHFGNHSCDPNLWLLGSYEFGCRRDVRAAEELTLDYATISGAGGFAMACSCGSGLCRGAVTGHDWRRPELQERYRGHWAPALQQRIEAVHE